MAARREYAELKAAWGVRPHLETLLRRRAEEIDATEGAGPLERDLSRRVRVAFGAEQSI